MKLIKTRCIFVVVLYFLTCSFTFAADQYIPTSSSPQKSSVGFKAIGRDASGTLGYIVSVPTKVIHPTGTPATDTAAINSCLYGGNAHCLVDADVTISAPLVVYSNTHLEVAHDATVTLLSSVGSGHMLVNRAAYNPQRSVTDGAITAGDATFSSAAADFTSADVGRTVIIQGAGWGLNGTGPGPFVANILSVNDQGSVELSNTAKQTVTGASVAIYDRDTNIKLTGGFWERGSVGGTNLTTNTIFLRRIDGLVIEDQRHHSAAGKYTLSIGDTTKVNVSRIDFDVFSDGVHITGPAQDITVRDITGYCDDDMMPIMTGDGDVVDNDVQGDISNITVENILGNSGTSNVKLLGSKDYTIINARINNVKTTKTSNIGVFLMDDELFGQGPSTLRNITIDGVEVPASSTGASVFSSASLISNLTIKNVKAVPGQTGHGIYFSSDAARPTVVEDLIVEGLYDFDVALGSSKYLLNISQYATVRNALVSNLILNPGNSNTGGILYSGTGTKVAIANFETKGSCGTFLNIASTSNIGAVAMLNGDFNGSGALLSYAKPVDLELTNVRMTNLASSALFSSYAESASITLRGDRLNYTDSSVYKWWGLSPAGDVRQTVKSFISNMVNPPQVPVHALDKAYTTGDVVFVNSGSKYFAALQDMAANSGHTPPGSGSDAYWNLLSSGSAQRLTDGGTGPASASYNNDLRGYITMGTGSPTTVTVQFNTSFANAPHVSIMPVGNTQPAAVASTTTGFTVSSSATFTGFAYKVEHLE